MVINGEEIITTETHPFYVNERGFVKAGELKVGDELLDSNGSILLLESTEIELTDEPTKVYNFEVEDFHTYFVGECGVWVHNANCKVHENGEIEITDWEGYPEGGPKPDGKLKLVDGDDYQLAKKQKNAANRKYHRNHPECDGMDIHEIHPVKFGGSPTDVNNKIPLPPSKHQEYTNFWNSIQRQAENQLKQL